MRQGPILEGGATMIRVGPDTATGAIGEMKADTLCSDSSAPSGGDDRDGDDSG